jgi:hypothetical protein
MWREFFTFIQYPILGQVKVKVNMNVTIHTCINMIHKVKSNLVFICGDYPIEKNFAVKTGNLIEPVTDEAFITLRWHRRIVQFLAQLTPADPWTSLHCVVLLPAEIFQIQKVDFVQQVQIFGEFFRRPEICHVDVRMRRSEIFVIRSTVYNWNEAIFQSAVKFLGHVIRTYGILSCDVEFVAIQDVNATNAVVGLAFQIAAFSKNVDGYVLCKVFDIQLSFAVRISVGTVPDC